MRSSPASVLFIVVLPLLAAGSQTNISSSPPSSSLEFETCFNDAASNNPMILKSRAGIAASKDRLWQAWSAFLPTAGVSAGLTSLGEEPPKIDVSKLLGPSPKPQEIFGNPLLQYPYRDNWSASIRVAMPLFTGGRNLAALSIAKDDLRINMEQARLQLSQLRIDVTRAYYGVIVNRTVKELTLLTIEQLNRRATIVSNFVAAGSATELDLMRTRVLRASWAAKYSSTARALEANLNRLSSLTGIEKKTLEFTNSAIPLPDPPSESADVIRERALSGRPESVISRLSEKTAREVRRMKASGLLPQVSASWNTFWAQKIKDPSFAEDDWRNWWDVRLTASWEIVNLSRWAETFQAGHDKQAKTCDLEAVRDRISSEADDAYLGLEESLKSYQASVENLDLAKMTADTARSKKLSGTITETEELESVLGETEARVQALRARYDLAVSMAEYRRLTGLE